VQRPIIPAIPADIANCQRRPVVGDATTGIDAGREEQERKIDRSRLVTVNRCLRRLICIVRDIRREIGGVEDEPVCADPRNQKRADRK